MSDEANLEQQIVSKRFQSHISDRVPEILYHYTTQQGLLGVATSDALWATKVQYMDDSTEFRLAQILAADRIRLRYKEEKDKHKKEKLHEISDAGSPFLNVFVACFCEDGDLLSQWRGYSGGNHGFSIGLESERLATSAEKESFRFARCIYDEAVQTQIIDQGITAYLNGGFDSVDFDSFLEEVGAFFKHPLFQEEKEWRLVSQATSILHSNVGFRAGRSMISPYFSIPLGAGMESAINHVIVGPCPHPEHSQNSIEMLLRKKGIKKKDGQYIPNVDVRSSEVPYRNW